jgi:hypothetical protein
LINKDIFASFTLTFTPIYAIILNGMGKMNPDQSSGIPPKKKPAPVANSTGLTIYEG